MKYAPLLREFVTQAHTTDLKTSKYSKADSGVISKASFGQGAQARIPWISFTKEGHTTANGIYPVYLYYKSQKLLVLAYGVSETNIPTINWSTEEQETVTDYLKRNGHNKPERYGSSFVFKVYDPNNLPSDEELDNDLNTIIGTYHETTEHHHKQPYEKRLEPSNTEQSANQESFDIRRFISAIQDAKLLFSDQLITRYVASLLTKPFVILTGLSGSGKTQLAKNFAQWIIQNDNQICIVPVGADWTNRDPLLGYPNGLKSNEYVLPETGVLQLIQKANKNKHLPYFLVLDEMNLSHVERYFADFLSAMESHGAILLHDLDIKDIPKKISLPKNLFIIGTVNIDETTYMFSPKVLDRANVIEFRIEKYDMQRFLEAPLRPKNIANSGSSMGQHFLELAQLEITTRPDSSLTNVLAFFEQLQQAGAEFGYRTAAEINRLMHYLNALGLTDGDEQLDIVILQKLLPKLHGSRRKLIPILEKMAEGCVDTTRHGAIRDYLASGQFDDAVLQPLTMGKLHRMYRSANDNGFASYAEA